MPTSDEQMERVMHLLVEWNPLGDMAGAVQDLDNYRTEAADILFHMRLIGSKENPACIVRDVLNQAFNLDLSLDECTNVAREIAKTMT